MDNSYSALRTPHSALRRGISLLEVLMSIFIITIGVLGVAALLPLAAHLANRGATADRASIAGNEAARQFRIRGMNNPANWLQADGVTGFSLDPTDPNSPLYPLGAKRFCLDPRGIAHGVVSNFPNGGTSSMQRITLRPQANADLSALSATQKKALADEICRMQDDLNFEVPDDTTLPPVNHTFKHDNGTPANVADDTVAVKRFSDGDFSWLATLVRESDSDLYTLSVVVFNKRNVPKVGDENLLTVNFLGGGWGGGDVTLTGAAAEFALPGQWLMLSSGDRFRWYRIVYASEFVPATSQREVSLHGRDWGTAAPFDAPQATLVTGAIAVYERTVRLETSSSW